MPLMFTQVRIRNNEWKSAEGRELNTSMSNTDQGNGMLGIARSLLTTTLTYAEAAMQADETGNIQEGDRLRRLVSRAANCADKARWVYVMTFGDPEYEGVRLLDAACTYHDPPFPGR